MWAGSSLLELQPTWSNSGWSILWPLWTKEEGEVDLWFMVMEMMLTGEWVVVVRWCLWTGWAKNEVTPAFVHDSMLCTSGSCCPFKQTEKVPFTWSLPFIHFCYTSTSATLPARYPSHGTSAVFTLIKNLPFFFFFFVPVFCFLTSWI